ncbi:MAG: FHA domain-containing protein [Acetobacteraceae bacterium]
MIGGSPRPDPSWSTSHARAGPNPILRRSDETTATDRVPLGHSLTVGRQAMPGQVVLDHPNVSRRHAAFEVSGDSIVLRDLGGANGTYVNGARVRGARSLVAGDRIDIGPFQLTFDGTALTRAWRVGNVELLMRGVSYDVRGPRADRAPHRILHSANLRISPCEFVAIIGANGSGKSTLMNIMAGRALPSEGTVLLNGSDLFGNFQALKQTSPSCRNRTCCTSSLPCARRSTMRRSFACRPIPRRRSVTRR